MTKRITKYVADDGTEFLRKGDCDIYPAVKAWLLLHGVATSPAAEAAGQPAATVDIVAGQIAADLLAEFVIKARTES